MPAFVNWLLRLVPTNPICMRLVYGGSRRLRHLYIRAGYLAVMIVVLLFMLLAKESGGALSVRELARAGAETFEGISYLQVFLICLLTPIFMAGAIAQEANPNTWNILLTTPLNSAQVVLGNLFGRLFFILALLFSTLPLFATTQFFGGVPGETIFASYAIAGTMALLVASIAVTLSVTRTAGRRAVFIFYAVVIAYLFVTYALDVQMRTAVAGATNAYHTTVLTPLNPFLALEVLLKSNRYVPLDYDGLNAMWVTVQWMGRPVSTFCWLCASISVLLMAVSTMRLRVIGANIGTVPWYRRMLGLGARGATERPARQVAQNPIAWRESTARGNTMAAIIMRWGFMAAGVALALIVIALFSSGALTAREFRTAILTIVMAEMATIALMALNTSATAVSREREDGTLDIILTTPIEPGPYLAGKLRGLIQFLLPMILVPVVTVGLVSLFVLFGGFGMGGGVMVTDAVPGTTSNVTLPVLLPEAVLALPLVLVPFIAFLVMVGLHWSIKSRGTIGSVVAAVGVVLVVVGILSACGAAAGSNIPIVGPVLTAISPINLVWALVWPASAMSESIRHDVAGARVSLVVGAAFAGVAYAAIVYGMHSSMKRGFMMTVRRLAGTSSN